MPLRFFLLALLLLTGCSPFTLLNTFQPPLTTVRTSSLAYVADGNPRHRLDVYRPKQATTRALPVIVFLYGGAWTSGARQDYAFAARALSEEGFIVVVPDYRIYPEVTFPAFVEDAAWATRWTRDHIAEYGGDPHRLSLMGHSAGAHIAGLLAYNPVYLHAVGLDPGRDIAAFVGLAGPYRFDPGLELRPVFNLTPATASIPNIIQPTFFVGPTAPPTLLIHGTDDSIVRAENSIELAEVLRAHHRPVSLLLYENKSHSDVLLALVWPFRGTSPTRRDITTYLRAVPPPLPPTPPLPQ